MEEVEDLDTDLEEIPQPNFLLRYEENRKQGWLLDQNYPRIKKCSWRLFNKWFASPQAV